MKRLATYFYVKYAGLFIFFMHYAMKGETKMAAFLFISSLVAAFFAAKCTLLINPKN